MKRLVKILLIVSVAVCIYLLCKPAVLLTADLASPSQEIRDAAAKVLRAKAKPTWKVKWLIFKARLKSCKTKNDVLQLLKIYGVDQKPVWGFGSIAEEEAYQLDDYWTLVCEFDTESTQHFYGSKFSPSWREVAVWPSTNFTGDWVNYYANGNKYTESQYQNGRRYGAFTNYEQDGRTNNVWHYANGKPNGLWTDYYQSGKVHVQTEYTNGIFIHSVWFNEDGTTNKTSGH